MTRVRMAHREPSSAYRWAEAIAGMACILVIGWLVVYGLPGPVQ